MSGDVITTHQDNHYSEEIDHLILDMIDEVREINHLWKTNPKILSMKFVNDFIPDFIKLYDLTGNHLRIKHARDIPTDNEIRDLVKNTIYYLDGVTGTNGHTQHIDSKAVLQGIQWFRDYMYQLQKEGIMVVH